MPKFKPNDKVVNIYNPSKVMIVLRVWGDSVLVWRVGMKKSQISYGRYFETLAYFRRNLGMNKDAFKEPFGLL